MYNDFIVLLIGLLVCCWRYSNCCLLVYVCCWGYIVYISNCSLFYVVEDMLYIVIYLYVYVIKDKLYIVYLYVV